MAWIELHQSVHKHRKTLAVAEALHKSRHVIVGHLTELWCWALDAAPDGGPLTAKQVAEGASWPGKADVFASALTDAGYLEVHGNGTYHLHNWADYAGKLVSRRAANKQRMRDARASHVQDTDAARAGATVQNRTVQDTTRDRNVDSSKQPPLAPDKPPPIVRLLASKAIPDLIAAIIDEWGVPLSEDQRGHLGKALKRYPGIRGERLKQAVTEERVLQALGDKVDRFEKELKGYADSDPEPRGDGEGAWTPQELARFEELREQTGEAAPSAGGA